MLDKKSSKPLYAQMEDLIREHLESGKWAPGLLIPSENELSREYGISRMTVRNVLSKFVQDGLLFRIPGKGTYVAEPKIVAKSLLQAGIREQLEQMGYEVSTKLLSINTTNVSKNICEQFGVDENTVFYEVRRLRSVKGEPLSLHTSYIPTYLCPGLHGQDLENDQLCNILSEKYGLKKRNVQEILESVPASKEEAKLLNVVPGYPLLLLYDVVIGENGKTFEFSKVLFRGEKIKIKLEF